MPPRRPKRPASTGADLRAFLAEQERDVFCVIDGVFLTAAAIEAGKSVTIHRFELPDWCPERNGGCANDALVLDEDDQLVDASCGFAAQVK